MTLEEIRELIKLVTETGVAELEVQRGDDRVRVRRNFDSNTREVVVPAAVPEPAPVASASEPKGDAATPEDTAAGVLDPTLVVVKSPIVGTFYDAPSPDAAPFVQPGDSVQPGQVLCIIESMKLMNEIEAEVAGVVVSKLASNAQPVEYGEALFAVRPH